VQRISGDTSIPLALRLCRACVDILQTDGASLSVASTDVERMTVCSTDDVAARLEDLQEVVGEGPGTEAFETGVQAVARVSAATAPEDGRWPMFADGVRQSIGELTVYAVAIRPGRTTLGVLMLHRASGGPLGVHPGQTQFLADAVGAALLRAPESHDTSTAAWTDRARIHQATGMVIAQLGVDAEDALALLRAHAFAKGSPLLDVASEVVERRLNFTDSRHRDWTEDR
jgi:hypothetical protein